VREALSGPSLQEEHFIMANEMIAKLHNYIYFSRISKSMGLTVLPLLPLTIELALYNLSINVRFGDILSIWETPITNIPEGI